MLADRHSYQHLRHSIECDQQKLEETTRNTLKLLDELKRKFFWVPGAERGGDP
jgi:hypothetical protein